MDTFSECSLCGRYSLGRMSHWAGPPLYMKINTWHFCVHLVVFGPIDVVCVVYFTREPFFFLLTAKERQKRNKYSIPNYSPKQSQVRKTQKLITSNCTTPESCAKFNKKRTINNAASSNHSQESPFPHFQSSSDGGEVQRRELLRIFAAFRALWRSTDPAPWLAMRIMTGRLSRTARLP